jgi:putative endonuclease
MKQTDKKGEKNNIGAQGEAVAANYLRKRSYAILDTNYLKKWGEIDIVARETVQNSLIVHFVEVKTVSYETKADLERAVSYGTWRPEENVHQKKIERMHRTINSWLEENDFHGSWQIDIIAVRLVPRERFATVKYLPNVIWG